MSQYNAEFFTRDFEYIHHDSVDELEIDDDYLAADTTELIIGRTLKVHKGHIVHIGGDIEFVGIVSDVNNEGEDSTTTLSIKPFLSIFDTDVLFDTKKQNSSSYYLEETICNLLKSIVVNPVDGDAEQKWKSISLSYTNKTKNWNLGVKATSDDCSYAITELYTTIICKAMSKYGVAINVRADFHDKKFYVTVATEPDNDYYIDADLDNVKCISCKVHDFGDSTNKLIVYNSTNVSSYKVYYLKADGSYGTTKPTGTNRILPVVCAESIATPSDQTPFATAADESASSTFDGLEWTDDIQIEVYVNDTLINTKELKYGQRVYVIRDGVAYYTLFTGRKFENDFVTLMFGTIREELTKQLRMK